MAAGGRTLQAQTRFESKEKKFLTQTILAENSNN